MAQKQFFLILMISMFCLLGGPGPVGTATAAEEKSYITIEGKDKTPATSSFEYQVHENNFKPDLATGDTPPAPGVTGFDEPELTKETLSLPHPGFERPDRTVVEDYSMLELLGIGLGVAIMIGIL